MNVTLVENNDINPMDENLDRIPEILYKYRSFDPCGYGLQLASNGEAYFASAKDFNDPFDNYFVPTSKFIDLKGEELVAYLREKAQQHFPKADGHTIQELIEEGKKQHQRLIEGHSRAREAVLEVQYKNFGIFSLSTDPKSLPMWAYYGNSHKGMCIGLRSSIIAHHQRDLLQHEELLMLHRVNYTKCIPQICVDIGLGGMTEDELHQLETTLYTKSEHWEHEQEYRLIFFMHSSQSYMFGHDAVAEILIGLRVRDEDIDKLIEQLRISNSKSIVKRAVQSQSEYELEFKEIHF